MAIDTDVKRASCLNFGGPTTRTLPIPVLGIGADDRAHLLWRYTGIGAPIVFTGLIGVTARDRLDALDAQNRTGIYLPALITLPDGSGYWLFGDGSRIVWGPGDEGIHQQARKRLGTLIVRRH